MVAAGTMAGLVTVSWFTVLHHIMISNIWFSFVPMLVAGAACGACLAWTYDVLFQPATLSTWTAFIGLHTLVLLLLGAVSVAVFEPVVPLAAVIAANQAPTALIKRAFPLTCVFVLAAALLTSVLWGRTPRKFGINLLTSTVLILLLGLNVSVLGLVQMSSDSSGVVAEFLGLVVLIMAGFGLALIVIQRGRFFQGAGRQRQS